MHKEIKKVAKAALRRGWRQLPDSKHHVLQHESGRKVQFSMSPSDGNAHRSMERELRRIEREAAEKENSDAQPC